MSKLPKFSFAPSELIVRTSEAVKSLVCSLLQDETTQTSPPLADMLSGSLKPSWTNIPLLDAKLQELAQTIETLNVCLSDVSGLFLQLKSRRRDMVANLREEERQRETARRVDLPPEIISYICSLTNGPGDIYEEWRNAKRLRAWGPYLFRSTECRVTLANLEEGPLAKTICPRFSRLLVEVSRTAMQLGLEVLSESAQSIFKELKRIGIPMFTCGGLSIAQCSGAFETMQPIMPYLRKLEIPQVLTSAGLEFGPHQQCCLGCRSGFKMSRCTFARIAIEDVRLYPCMFPSLSCLSLLFSDTKHGTLKDALSETMWPSVRTLKLMDSRNDYNRAKILQPRFFLISPRVDSFPNLRKLVIISYRLRTRVVTGLLRSLHCPRLESLFLGDLTRALDNATIKSGFASAMIEVMEAIDTHCVGLKELKFYASMYELEKRTKHVTFANSLILAALTPSGGQKPLLSALTTLSLPYDTEWHVDPIEILGCLSKRKALGMTINTFELTASNRCGPQEVLRERLGFYATNVVLSPVATWDFYNVEVVE